MTKPICKIDNCKNTERARGWCNMHYERWRLHGDPGSAELRTHSTPSEALRHRLVPQGGCLIWTGGKDSHGYGQIADSGRTYKVHRYVWEQANGPIPGNLEIDHICHNRACAKVEHLRLVTRAQNSSHLSGPRSTSSTGHRNVYRVDGGWRVQIQHRGKVHHFGKHDNLDHAIALAAEKRQELFGQPYAGKG